MFLSKAGEENPLGVTEMKHLYDAWQHADNSNYKVSELFDSWDHLEGYPILYVERSYNDHRVRFTQVNDSVCKKLN